METEDVRIAGCEVFLGARWRRFRGAERKAVETVASGLFRSWRRRRPGGGGRWCARRRGAAPRRSRASGPSRRGWLEPAVRRGIGLLDHLAAAVAPAALPDGPAIRARGA